ncbi:MAG: DUF4238 domain-containing protein [Bacteroidia bacterium]|nr:DUF4238 domain-containing protein [Bacteroidia bacterium]MBP7260043.1 DUF4238 domain-containing protein [Bacteroidia bacterium]MBP9179132.1 DUF4238 domain-containing protein [Bacteroidia bacterium]MBP9723659.1 DUF4238 domain-containing protein [Bacteroidia bacterium]
MTIAKNHHYIPQSYLRNFAFEKNREHYVFVRYRGEKFHTVNIRNICSENYFYTLPSDHVDPNIIETFYANNIDNVFPLLYEIAHNFSIEEVDQDTIKKIIRSAVSLYVRTPRFLRMYTEHIKLMLANLHERAQDYPHVEKAKFLGEEIDIRTVDFKQLEEEFVQKGKIIFLTQHLDVLEAFVESRKANCIGINTISDNSEFITCDNPIILANSKTGDNFNLLDPKNTLYLPLGPKHMLAILPESYEWSGGKVLRIMSEKDFTIGINSRLENNSESWIIGSKDSVNNYLVDIELYNREIPENFQRLDDIKEKAKLMDELNVVLNQSGGELNVAVITKIVELSKNRLFKDDPNFERHLKNLKEQGLIQ